MEKSDTVRILPYDKTVALNSIEKRCIPNAFSAITRCGDFNAVGGPTIMISIAITIIIVVVVVVLYR